MAQDIEQRYDELLKENLRLRMVVQQLSHLADVTTAMLKEDRDTIVALRAKN